MSSVVSETGGKRVRCAPGFSAEEAMEAVQRHLERCVSGVDMLKNTAQIRVSIVELSRNHRRVCVKEFRQRSLGYRLRHIIVAPPIMREWRALRRFGRLGAPIPGALALVRARGFNRDGGFLIAEALENARQLDELILDARDDWNARRDEKLRFISALAGFARGLHERGIWHRDMKCSNVLARCQDSMWEFFLVDSADLRCFRKVAGERRLRNLAQLSSSAPLVITRADRLRFLRQCLPESSNSATLARTWRRIQDLARRRLCVWERREVANQSNSAKIK